MKFIFSVNDCFYKKNMFFYKNIINKHFIIDKIYNHYTYFSRGYYDKKSLEPFITNRVWHFCLTYLLI